MTPFSRIYHVLSCFFWWVEVWRKFYNGFMVRVKQHGWLGRFAGGVYLRQIYTAFSVLFFPTNTNTKHHHNSPKKTIYLPTQQTSLYPPYPKRKELPSNPTHGSAHTEPTESPRRCRAQLLGVLRCSRSWRIWCPRGARARSVWWWRRRPWGPWIVI